MLLITVVLLASTTIFSQTDGCTDITIFGKASNGDNIEASLAKKGTGAEGQLTVNGKESIKFRFKTLVPSNLEFVQNGEGYNITREGEKIGDVTNITENDSSVSARLSTNTISGLVTIDQCDNDSDEPQVNGWGGIIGAIGLLANGLSCIHERSATREACMQHAGPGCLVEYDTQLCGGECRVDCRQ